MKTRLCEHCVHAEPLSPHNNQCAKGHKPRFYLPRDYDHTDINWGWKRKCADYKNRPTIPQPKPGSLTTGKPKMTIGEFEQIERNS